VTVVVEDGRNCLSRSAERYDVIISDLFVPWEAGTGNLYTLEHYRTAHDRLERGGVYVQWIPLYQVSDRELGIIARTMDEVFDEVVAWRGDSVPGALGAGPRRPPRRHAARPDGHRSGGPVGPDRAHTHRRGSSRRWCCGTTSATSPAAASTPTAN
jgi:hypothetical protein